MIAGTAPDPETATAGTVPAEPPEIADGSTLPDGQLGEQTEPPKKSEEGPPIGPAAEEVVRGEGPAEHAPPAAVGGAAVQAWLCTRAEAPRHIEQAAIPELVADDDNFVWVDLINYAPADLHGVAEILRLHATAVHTTLASWKRPRLDVFSDQFFVTVTVPELNFQSYRILARELDVFVGHNFLVSAHKTALPFGDHILARAQQSPQLLDQDSAFMLYVILDELLDYYEDLQEQLQDAIETMEARALVAVSEEYLQELQRFKRFAFAASQLTAHHQQIFEAFLRPDFSWVSGEGVEVYFRDLESRFARLNEALLATKDGLNGAFDLYVSHMAHRTNQIMKLLTIVSTMLLPTSVIVGFFGTNNLSTIPLLVHPAGFVIMVLIILALTGGALVYFQRQGWLR